MPPNLTDDKSKLAPNHYLKQCWPSSTTLGRSELSHHVMNSSQEQQKTKPNQNKTKMESLRACWIQTYVNTLRLGQNCRHFADDIFKCISLNENVWILLKFSCKCVPKVRINDIPALVQIMALVRPGDKTLSRPMMVYLTDAHMRHSASTS